MKVFESLILSYLLNSLWQVPLLFLGGWMATLSVRRAGAAAEHRVWVGVLFLQALLPASSLLPLERVLWQWLLALTAWLHAVPADTHVSVVMGAAHADGGFRFSAALLTPAFISYGAVSIYLIARFFWRTWMLSEIRRESVEQSWLRRAQQFGLKNVSIAASSRVFGPVAIGRTEQVVLLPTTMVGTLPDKDFDTVIAHEFAHMRRDDFTKNLLYELVSLPVAYHPLLWLTQQRIAESREMICDQMAADGSGRNEYARSLMRLASLLVHGTPVRIPHAIGIFDANTFERRLMKLNEVTNELRGAQRFAAMAACAAFGIATCGSALALRVDVTAPASVTGSQNDPTTSPKKLAIPSGVMAGNRLTGDNPQYPEAAKKAKIQGTVVLDAVISKEGNIEHLRVLSGPRELQTSSLAAVKDWKYKPYMLNGEDVEVETTINVVYALGK